MINLKKDFTFDAMFSLPRGVCANTNSSMNIVLLKKQKSDINNRVFYGGLETKKGLKSGFADLLKSYQLFKTGKTPISDNIKEHLLEGYR